MCACKYECWQLPEALDLKLDLQAVVSHPTLVVGTCKDPQEQQYKLLIAEPSPGPELFTHKEMLENQIKKTLLCVYACFASMYGSVPQICFVPRPEEGIRPTTTRQLLQTIMSCHVIVGNQTQVYNHIKCS